MDSHHVDFAALAKAVGARGVRIDSVEDLEKLPPDTWSSDVPTVLDVAIDPTASFSVHGRVAELKNFNPN